jgi:hypothetical protein
VPTAWRGLGERGVGDRALRDRHERGDAGGHVVAELLVVLVLLDVEVGAAARERERLQGLAERRPGVLGRQLADSAKAPCTRTTDTRTFMSRRHVSGSRSELTKGADLR